MAPIAVLAVTSIGLKTFATALSFPLPRLAGERGRGAGEGGRWSGGGGRRRGESRSVFLPFGSGEAVGEIEFERLVRQRVVGRGCGGRRGGGRRGRGRRGGGRRIEGSMTIRHSIHHSIRHSIRMVVIVLFHLAFSSSSDFAHQLRRAPLPFPLLPLSPLSLPRFPLPCLPFLIAYARRGVVPGAESGGKRDDRRDLPGSKRIRSARGANQRKRLPILLRNGPVVQKTAVMKDWILPPRAVEDPEHVRREAPGPVNGSKIRMGEERETGVARHLAVRHVHERVLACREMGIRSEHAVLVPSQQ
mmetsp:Transcript_19552/g.35246  ORF Transcript_19552/g.35246 Transcript_19552/m.35246 type:complete len:303 (+) Transcript_19552:1931-2839(+)